MTEQPQNATAESPEPGSSDPIIRNAEPGARVFKYGDQSWEDPGAEYTNDDVKAQLTTYFPELARADTKTRELDDGRTEVEFVKRAGTKG